MDSRFDRLGLLVRELHDGSRVVVCLFGGHVLSWVAGGRERLYLSGTAVADGQHAIRGGVPVCFPQFSGRGTLPKHGFARTQRWREVPSDDAQSIRLQLVENDETLRLWPHRFCLELHVTLQPRALAMRLEVRNTGEQDWSFTGALHTYLRVEDVGTARLVGLQGLRVEDTLRNVVETVEGESPNLAAPIDNVYHDVSSPLDLRGRNDALRIEQSGFADAVVWNPGAGAASRLPDVGAGDERHFLCVEAAQVRTPVVVRPGGVWMGSQGLRVL